VAFCNGKKHDFELYKRARIFVAKGTKIVADSGFQGIAKIHADSITPRKKSKNKPLSKEDKSYNRELSSKRIGNENAIGFIKRFKIVSERYRNRRRRFGLRFTLIAGICNFELGTI
jgi:IS5 family transposase